MVIRWSLIRRTPPSRCVVPLSQFLKGSFQTRERVDREDEVGQKSCSNEMHAPHMPQTLHFHRALNRGHNVDAAPGYQVNDLFSSTIHASSSFSLFFSLCLCTIAVSSSFHPHPRSRSLMSVLTLNTRKTVTCVITQTERQVLQPQQECNTSHSRQRRLEDTRSTSHTHTSGGDGAGARHRSSRIAFNNS